MRFSVLWVFLSFVLAGLYTADSGVRELTAKSFGKQVLRSNNVTIVEFYAPWCPHCQSLVKELSRSAKSLKGIANVVAVDCDNPVNRELCQRSGVKGYPTIKVFQPAKLTDVDLKDIVEGKKVKLGKPRVYTYTGSRDARSINKFAIEKLRNYAASLDSEDSIQWLKPNKIPRVVMLPGTKYKSKSIAPLLKVLSSEYFGKLRFAYIPRRADGAWNLLGLAAVDDSQLAYMGDDREPVVYKGSLKKAAVKQFLDEQYELEMARRVARGLPLKPERSEAANGLEYVKEDAQKTEMEHVAIKKRELEELEARRKRERQAAIERGHFQPKSVEEATPTVEATSPEETSADEEGEEAVELEAPEEDGQVEADLSPDEEPEDVSIDGGDDALLDEIDVEWSDEELVKEGPEVVASIRAAESARRAAAASAAPANPKPSPALKNYDNGFHSVDDLVTACIRNGGRCALLVTRPEFADNDVQILVRSLERIPRNVKRDTTINFIKEGVDEGLDAFIKDVGFEFRGKRHTADGEEVHGPGVMFFDYRKNKMTFYNDDYTAVELAKFVVAGHNRQLSGERMPDKYYFYVTAEELEREGLVKDEFSKDEL